MGTSSAVGESKKKMVFKKKGNKWFSMHEQFIIIIGGLFCLLSLQVEIMHSFFEEW